MNLYKMAEGRHVFLSKSHTKGLEATVGDWLILLLVLLILINQFICQCEPAISLQNCEKK